MAQELEIKEIKDYLRIDHDEDDELIKMLKAAAEVYLANAGVVKRYTNALYRLAILLLMSHSYENRVPVVIGSISNQLEFSLSSIIIQLQLQVSSEVET